MIVEEHPPQEGADAFLLPFLTLPMIKQKNGSKLKTIIVEHHLPQEEADAFLSPFLALPVTSSHLIPSRNNRHFLATLLHFWPF